MQNNINSNKYILNIKFGELSEFGTPCQSLVTNSGAIPEESNHSGAIPADSGHSCGFRCHSGGFRCHSGGITGFRTESVGHCKVLRLTSFFGFSTDLICQSQRRNPMPGGMAILWYHLQLKLCSTWWNTSGRLRTSRFLAPVLGTTSYSKLKWHCFATTTWKMLTLAWKREIPISHLTSMTTHSRHTTLRRQYGIPSPTSSTLD